MFFRKILLSVIALTCSCNLVPAILIKGDIDSATASFSFALGPHVFSQARGFLYVTAGEEKTDNEFAVSLAGSNTDRFFALAEPIVTLNGEKDQPNPITGAAIDHIDLMGDLPFVVKKNDADKVFYFSRVSPVVNEEIPQEESADSASKDAEEKSSASDKNEENNESHGTRLVESPVANDAKGDPTTGIIGIVGGEIDGNMRNFYAVVKPSVGVFGDDGSGVAVGQFAYGGKQEEESELLDALKAETKQRGGKIVPFEQTEEELALETITFFDASNGTFDGNKAAPLDRTSDSLAISSALASIADDPIKPLFVETLKTLYVPLRVTAGAGGARGIALGRIEGTTLDFKPIAPDSAFGADNIVGSSTPGATVSMLAIRATFTSTALPYIIVVGGVGSPAAVSKKVFALPIVNEKEKAELGVIAKKDQTPIFTPGGEPNGFREPAVTVADMPDPTDAAAMVGGGDAPGVVTDIVVATDAVFVSVKDSMGRDAGLFYSQALFDDLGRIRVWTDWQRVGGPDSASDMQGLAYDRLRIDFWFLPLDGTDPSKTVFRTRWDLAEDEKNTALGMTLSSLFSEVSSGIQDLKSYPEHTQGSPQTPTNN